MTSSISTVKSDYFLDSLLASSSQALVTSQLLYMVKENKSHRKLIKNPEMLIYIAYCYSNYGQILLLYLKIYLLI